MEWVGELRSSDSLIQCNGRISTLLEALGLEVLDGREQLEEGPGQTVLQRLNLVIGRAGEVLGTIAIEARRDPSLPPAF
jgi:hypothetical protein